MQDHRRSLGTAEATDGGAKRGERLGEVIGGAIGEGLVRLGPHVLGRVEFGRIGGGDVDPQPG
jgi:hypothetical protein